MNPNSLGARPARYICETLGGCGLAILDAKLAMAQRPDIWASPLEAGMDWTGVRLRIDRFADEHGLLKFIVTFAGIEDQVRVIARTDDRLAERLYWLTGRKALSVAQADQLFGDGKQEPTATAPIVDGEPIPDYPCVARTEALRKLGITRDPKFDRAPDGPGPKTGYNA